MFLNLMHQWVLKPLEKFLILVNNFATFNPSFGVLDMMVMVNIYQFPKSCKFCYNDETSDSYW